MSSLRQQISPSVFPEQFPGLVNVINCRCAGKIEECILCTAHGCLDIPEAVFPVLFGQFLLLHDLLECRCCGVQRADSDKMKTLILAQGKA